MVDFTLFDKALKKGTWDVGSTLEEFVNDLPAARTLFTSSSRVLPTFRAFYHPLYRNPSYSRILIGSRL